jgi:thiamine pyrophosphate-dependent acetolactate synthase large subunit-like protein
MGQVHGGRLVAQALKRHGIDVVFTLCGGHIQAIYDGCIDEGIRLIDTRHEQTAGFAADAYARVTGRPGVALVTAGPGVTNTVTALATAQRAGVPMICIGGAAPRSLSDMGSLQELDSVRLMTPVCKWAASIPETRRIKEYIDSAFRIAQAGFPGPVYLEAPLDLLMDLADDELPATAPMAPARPGADPTSVEQAARLLAAAERPCFIVGSQLRWSPERYILERAARQFAIPFFLNGMARGALGAEHPCLFSHARRHALERSDLVIVLGTPLDFRVGYGRAPLWNRDARVIQVDLDAAQLGRNRTLDLGVQADVGYFLASLLERAEPKQATQWIEELSLVEQQKKKSLRAEIDKYSNPPNPLRVCHELGKRLGKSDVVIGDGGDFVATAAHILPLAWPQLWMDPGPLGTLGIGPGYAMAASLARPDARTVVLFGDGAFGLSALEFEALARHRLPVVTVIGNDAAWTQIRRGQIQLYGEERAVATRLEHTRYEQVVQALGGKGFWVERIEELGPALDGAFAADVPSCVNVRIASSDFRKSAISV